MDIPIWEVLEKEKLEKYKEKAEQLNITLQEYLLLKIAIWCENKRIDG